MSAVAAVLFIGVIAAAGIWLAWGAVSFFLGLPPETQTPLAALVGVLSVPVITYFTSRSIERRRATDNAIRERKTELYDSMIAGFMRMMNLQRAEEGMSESELLAFFADATPRLLTYGSRRVIRSWTEFRTVSAKHPDDPYAVMWAMEDFIKAVRADLGHSTVSTQKGELIGTFVNDVQDALKKAGHK